MDEKQMQHGHDWAGEDLTGWHLSEKLDGVRLYWDGKTAWTRSGRRITLPERIRAALPAMHLDGELWAGRGGFLTAREAVNLGKWTDACRYVVFDAPHAAGNWPDRLSTIHAAIIVNRRLNGLKRGKTVSIIEAATCASTDHAFVSLETTQACKGEGLIARHPDLDYQPGRTRRLLKLKVPRAFTPYR